mgnify:CR=1 FL=1
MKIENSCIPPGQYVTDKFPVFTTGNIPVIHKEDWTFKLFGEVESNVTLAMEDFMSLKTSIVRADFHCVTGWSRLANIWRGVLFSELMKIAKPTSSAKFVMVSCYGGYSANMPIEVLLESNVLFAYSHDGQDLTVDHGGPIRLVVPNRYAWKSAKWVNALEFMDIN